MPEFQDPKMSDCPQSRNSHIINTQSSQILKCRNHQILTWNFLNLEILKNTTSRILKSPDPKSSNLKNQIPESPNPQFLETNRIFKSPKLQRCTPQNPQMPKSSSSEIPNPQILKPPNPESPQSTSPKYQVIKMPATNKLQIPRSPSQNLKIPHPQMKQRTRWHSDLSSLRRCPQ